MTTGNHPDKILNGTVIVWDAFDNKDTEGLNLPMTADKSKLLFRNVGEWPKLAWKFALIFCVTGLNIFFQYDIYFLNYGKFIKSDTLSTNGM